MTHFPQLYPVKIRFWYKVCYYEIIKDRILSLTVLKMTNVTLGVFTLKMISGCRNAVKTPVSDTNNCVFHTTFFIRTFTKHLSMLYSCLNRLQSYKSVIWQKILLTVIKQRIQHLIGGTGRARGMRSCCLKLICKSI